MSPTNGQSSRRNKRPALSKRSVSNGPNGTADKGLHFTIPSDFLAGRGVQEQILEAALNNGFNEESVFAIRLALEEALINAIKHGNQLDPSKNVRIDCEIGPRRAEIVIEDEGPGFERSRVPDPTAEENLCRLHGRGILLMESYMNAVEWSRGGRRVKMVKRNKG